MFNASTEQRQRGYTHQLEAATVAITSLILGFQLRYLDQFGWVIHVTVVVVFCWVEVVINKSDDVLHGTVELLSFPFGKFSEVTQAVQH